MNENKTNINYDTGGKKTTLKPLKILNFNIGIFTYFNIVEELDGKYNY